MLKKFLLLWMLAFCIACSEDSPVEKLPEPEKSFNVILTPSVNEVLVDMPFTIKVQANEGIKEISRILNDGVQSVNPLMPGTALEAEFYNLHLQFSNIGTQEIVLKFLSTTGKKITRTLEFDVKRGEAVKIVGFKINSFYNMDGTWDQEYSESDANRLADIQFGFRKMLLGNFSNPTPGMGLWYLSPVYPNMEQLEWDLSGEGFYISETSRLELGISDEDGDGTGQDLSMGFQNLMIRFLDYRETKPSEISIIDEEYGLDVTFSLEWL